MQCCLRGPLFRAGLPALRRWAVLSWVLLSIVAAHDARAIVVEGTSAGFEWTPASGPVAGYRVFVIRNGLAGSAPEAVVSTTSTTIAGQIDETIAVQVAAFDVAGNQGPVSPPSDSVTLGAAPPPPPFVVVDVQGDSSLQAALGAAVPGEQVVAHLAGTSKQLLDTAPPADLADGETWGLDQLIVGGPGAPATVRLIDAVGLDESSPLASLPTVTLAGLGNGAPCARDGAAGLVIHPGSRLVLGGIDLYAFDGQSCVHVNELFPGPTDPNVVPYGGGEIQLYGDLEGDGVLDPDDNCLLVANPDQCDADRDGFGNRCDLDANGDGVVGLDDLDILMTALLDGTATIPALDVNCDGAVGLDDYGMIFEGIDRPVGPSGLACTADASCGGP